MPARLKAGAIVSPDFYDKTPFDYTHKLKASTVRALRDADDTGCESLRRL